MCTPVRTHTEPLKWVCFTVCKIYLNNVVLQTKPLRGTEVTKVVVNAEQDGGYSRNNQERAGVVFSEGQKHGDPGPGLFFNKPFATREFCNHSCSCFGNSPTEHAKYSGLPCAAPPLATPRARDPGTRKAKGQPRSNPGSLLHGRRGLNLNARHSSGCCCCCHPGSSSSAKLGMPTPQNPRRECWRSAQSCPRRS